MLTATSTLTRPRAWSQAARKSLATCDWCHLSGSGERPNPGARDPTGNLMLDWPANGEDDGYKTSTAPAKAGLSRLALHLCFLKPRYYWVDSLAVAHSPAFQRLLDVNSTLSSTHMNVLSTGNVKIAHLQLPTTYTIRGSVLQILGINRHRHRLYQRRSITGDHHRRLSKIKENRLRKEQGINISTWAFSTSTEHQAQHHLDRLHPSSQRLQATARHAPAPIQQTTT